jgi:glycosyltransferase involved in cell wall biosynthesis
MYAAINKGMRSAKGEWLTYINGDDLLYADAIMEALRDVSNDISMVYGNIDYIDKYGRFLFPWRSPSVRWIHKFMAYYSPIPQQGTMFRSCVFKENNGFDTNFKYSADYDFWVRTLQAGFKPEKYKRKSIAGFRLMSEQLSQSQKGNMAPEGIAIRNRLKENLKPLEKFMMGSWATIYRVMTTLDSRFMRGKQGLDQDKRS